MDQDDLPDDGTYGSGEDGHRHRHHHRTVTKRRWMVSPLWVVIFVQAVAIVSLVIWALLLGQDFTSSTDREKNLEQKLKDVQAELDGLKYDVTQNESEQQESCMPKTIALKLEEFLDVNRGYVKRAFFVAAGKKGKKILEYKIILKNDTKINLVPKFDIIFFNTAGNQVATAKFGYGDDGAATEKELENGEVRTVDGTFDFSDMPQPELFMIKLVDD